MNNKKARLEQPGFTFLITCNLFFIISTLTRYIIKFFDILKRSRLP
nr:MAG TPA: hypothetical protein [Podoviridae sp. ctY3D12]